MSKSSLTRREKKLARRSYLFFCVSIAIAIALVVLFAIGLSIVTNG